ncbi:MAG TPA: hypothetical protein ENI70_00890 [Candidatus Peregrinibacteria bacterium]|nr:hypothetical protein [Candidatus Peregrinibacteria bacterium]
MTKVKKLFCFFPVSRLKPWARKNSSRIIAFFLLLVSGGFLLWFLSISFSRITRPNDLARFLPQAETVFLAQVQVEALEEERVQHLFPENYQNLLKKGGFSSLLLPQNDVGFALIKENYFLFLPISKETEIPLEIRKLPSLRNFRWKDYLVFTTAPEDSSLSSDISSSLYRSSRYHRIHNNFKKNSVASLFIDTENLVTFLGKNNEKYLKFKNFLPQTVKSIGVDLGEKEGKVLARFFINIDKSILPGKKLFSSFYKYPHHLISSALETSSFTVDGKNLAAKIEQIVSGLHENNLPLALELEGFISNLQERLLLSSVDFQEVLSLFRGEYLISFSKDFSDFLVVLEAKSEKDLELAKNTFELIRQNTRFRNEKIRNYRLPDGSMGSEKIPGETSPLEAEGEILSFLIPQANWQLSLIIQGNKILIASSKELLNQVLQKPEDSLWKEKFNLLSSTVDEIFYLNLKENSLITNEVVKNFLQNYSELIGGLNIFDDGFLIEISLQP